jgi:hypothetical protein
MWKRKREHEEKWEETRDQRVCFQSILWKLTQLRFTFSVWN